MNNLIFGPPGTGKTTTLSSEVKKCLSEGVAKNQIAAITYTRTAAKRARYKAAQTLGIEASDEEIKELFPYFRTIHAFVREFLKIKDNEIFQEKEHLQMFGKDNHYFFTPNEKKKVSMEELMTEKVRVTPDDVLYSTYNYSRKTKLDYADIVSSLPPDLEHADHLTYDNLYEFGYKFSEWKKENSLLDFNDWLSEALTQHSFPNLEYLFVDEAQDCYQLQWDIIKKWEQNSKNVTKIGDDDQAIFTWDGANPNLLLQERETTPKENIRTLPISYRLHENHRKYLEKILNNIETREQKEWTTLKPGGNIMWLRPGDIIYTLLGILRKKQKESIFVLSYNYVSLLTFLREYLIPNGIPFEIKERASRFKIRPLTKTKSANIFIQVKTKSLEYDWNLLSDHLPEKIKQYNGEDLIYFVHGAKAKIGRYLKRMKKTSISIELLKGLGATEFVTSLLSKGDPTVLRIPYWKYGYFEKVWKQFGIEGFINPEQITLSTIHSVKGEECDTTILLNDLTPKQYSSFEIRRDEMYRVMYVGCSRQRGENLYLVTEPINEYYAKKGYSLTTFLP